VVVIELFRYISAYLFISLRAIFPTKMATFSILTITLFATLKKCAMKNHGNISNHGNNSINLREMEKPQKQVFSRLFWRKRWDSNPRYLAVHRISSKVPTSKYEEK